MEYTLYTSTSKVWEQTIEDIDHAKKSILLNNFMITDLKEGKIGSKVIKSLQKAVKRGVKVELILDAFGSLELWRKSKWLLEGMDVRFYNDRPKIKHKWLNIFLRDHRKLTVIDDDISHIGGVVLLIQLLHTRQSVYLIIIS
jgi:cardiolipin synthase